MADAYLRLDAQIPRERLDKFLQGIRELEQEAPDEIHLIMQVYDNDASMKESQEMLANLGLPFQTIIHKQ